MVFVCCCCYPSTGIACSISARKMYIANDACAFGAFGSESSSSQCAAQLDMWPVRLTSKRWTHRRAYIHTYLLQCMNMNWLGPVHNILYKTHTHTHILLSTTVAANIPQSVRTRTHFANITRFLSVWNERGKRTQRLAAATRVARRCLLCNALVNTSRYFIWHISSFVIELLIFTMHSNFFKCRNWYGMIIISNSKKQKKTILWNYSTIHNIVHLQISIQRCGHLYELIFKKMIDTTKIG